MTWPAPSHYLNQCWNLINRTLRNKLQWNYNRTSWILLQENEFEKVVWKMAAIFSRPQCVNKRGSRYLKSPYIWPTYRHWYVHRLALEILRPKKTCRLVQTTVWKKIHSCKKTFQFELFDLLQKPRSVKCVSFVLICYFSRMNLQEFGL